MDSNSEDGGYFIHDCPSQQDATQYRVMYSHDRNTEQAVHDKHEEFNKKRHPASRSGNIPGRVKRVVSCKRKTHHLTVARRKQTGNGRSSDAANKENAANCTQGVPQQMLDRNPWDLHVKVSKKHSAAETSSGQDDCSTLTELAKDHHTLTDVLYGRNLRLKVSLTLWKRSTGELLTYLLRIQDVAVFVDLLPLISKSVTGGSPGITIGCCVDLFPLVRKVLTQPYEEYLMVGLQWINSVLTKWPEELKASGFSASTKPSLDRNFQVFSRQLLELWQEEPSLRSLPGNAGDLAKVIHLFMSQLS